MAVMRQLAATEESASPFGSDVLLARSSGVDSAYQSTRTASDDDHIYEEMEVAGPPRLAPLSGVRPAEGKELIRPIAFKPVLVAGSPSLSPSPTAWERGTPSPEDVLREKEAEITYLRQTLEHNEQVIFKVYAEKEQAWLRELRRMRHRCDAKLKSCHNKHATQLNQMKQEWQLLEAQVEQLRREKATTEEQLRREKATTEEQLRREKATTEEQLRREKATTDCQLQVAEGELAESVAQLEETRWALGQKSGEISLLKAQLRDCQAGNSSRAGELLALKTQLKECREQAEQQLSELQLRLASTRQEALRSRQAHEMQRRVAPVEAREQLTLEVNRLRAEVDAIRCELRLAREEIEGERARWTDEKEKVIRYQKQLQLSYVQMYKRNRTLEWEVQQLVLEVGNRGEESQC